MTTASEQQATSSLAAVRVFKRLAADQSLRSALFAFTLSRALILAILVLVGVMTTTPDAYPGHFTTTIDLYKKSVPRTLSSVIRTADVNWYLGIAQDGYERRPFDNQVPHNWVFFPGFPLLVHLASYITGEVTLTGLFISHVCLLIALFLVHRVALLFGYLPGDADRAVFYLAVFPTSYFFSLPMSESLFLLLTVACFYSAKRERWLLAALFGVLASITRVTGVLMLPALAVLYWEMYRPIQSVSSLRKSALALFLIPAGLLAFVLYLHSLTGNYLAFMGAQAAWGRRLGMFWMVFIEYLRNPGQIAFQWDFRLLNFIAIVLAFTSIVFLLRQRKFSFAIYTLLTAIIVTSTALLQSQARYMMILFPIFFILGVAGRNSRVDQIVRTLSVALLALMTALFAAHYTVALS